MIKTREADFPKNFNYKSLETEGHKLNFQFKSNGYDCSVFMLKKPRKKDN